MDLQSISGKALDELGESLDPMVVRRVFKDTAVGLNGNEVVYHVPERDEDYRQRISESLEVKKNGGPAFGEFHQTGDCAIKNGGMSLRDYFAAKAMEGMVCDGSGWHNDAAEHIAKAAFVMADAMLAERAK